MPNSYEHSFQHNLDDVIDASDAVLAIGTEKVDTTTLKDNALSNDATIHGAMPSNGYFLGRRFDGNDYLDCGNDSSLISQSKTYNILFNPTGDGEVFIGMGVYENYGSYIWIYSSGNVRVSLNNSSSIEQIESGSGFNISQNEISLLSIVINTGDKTVSFYKNGTHYITKPYTINYIDSNSSNFYIGQYSTGAYRYNGIIYSSLISSLMTSSQIRSLANTFNRLPLYSHNFERYPNSDTSLTSVFPYTSGIITSGSFNKTDGLKCTSAGQIIFSNSFEFDGSEYITLVINGVEYSGTTTVTQGTITATIAQGSNDITIDMGTNDVLEDVRIQFRGEV